MSSCRRGICSEFPGLETFDNVPHAFIWIFIVLYHKHKNVKSI